MDKIRVMQLIDTLDMGGAERVAVNIANALPPDRYESFLCTTRREGPLKELIGDHVGFINLNRRWRFDYHAIRRLRNFVRANEIQILHAHSTSILLANLACMVMPSCAFIWHIHYGGHPRGGGATLHYRGLCRRAAAVIAVNYSLADWAREKLKIPEKMIYYIPNFITATISVRTNGSVINLPGKPEFRVACVANIRPEKDQVSLVRGFRVVATTFPEAYLFLIGDHSNVEYVNIVRNEIKALDLSGNVVMMGQQREVLSILRNCGIGVVSSVIEGLPLALLEYGKVGLPVVATAVGECPTVLGDGDAGILVSPGNAEEIGQAIINLLNNPALRLDVTTKLTQRVKRLYDQNIIMKQLCSVYEEIVFN